MSLFASVMMLNHWERYIMEMLERMVDTLRRAHADDASGVVLTLRKLMVDTSSFPTREMRTLVSQVEQARYTLLAFCLRPVIDEAYQVQVEARARDATDPERVRAAAQVALVSVASESKQM
jgi:squalene cyclase